MPHRSLRGLLQALRAPQDERLREAAARGEQTIARIRVVVLALIFVIQFLPNANPLEQQVGLAISGAGLALSILLLGVVRRRYRPPVGYASCALDVSLVSLSLVAFLVLDRPLTAVNSRIAFDCYFVAIAGAALRYDWRHCVLTGLLAVAQYLGVVGYAATHFDLDSPRYAPFEYGLFRWNPQIARLVLLGTASLVSTIVVLRSQRLWMLGSTDRLTGLHNRGLFEERLAGEASRAERHGRPYTVAMLDVDHFKRFNDAHGHAGGDRALQAVASVLREGTRLSDLVARYGGEEFALLLTDTSPHEALPRLEALREAIAQIVIPVGAEDGRLTASIGVAGVPGDPGTVGEMLALADRRLYEGKRLGRNRVVGPGTLPWVG